MPNVSLSSDQKAQLIGWLNREKDHLLSIVSMGCRIATVRITGALDCCKADLEFVTRVRTEVHTSPTDQVTLLQSDVDTLCDVAHANEYKNREDFWKSIIESINAAS